MRGLLFIILSLLTISCGKDDDEPCTEVTLGENIELQDVSKICIDGTEYTFKPKDERCECGTFCVWEGEFVFSFEDSNGNVIYTYRESLGEDNVIPPFGESFQVLSFEAPTECGDDSRIDEVKFTLLFN